MSEWLDLMLEEMSRKRAEAAEAAEEERRREGQNDENQAQARTNQSTDNSKQK